MGNFDSFHQKYTQIYFLPNFLLPAKKTHFINLNFIDFGGEFL